ncbi:MAG: HU family DNA-binding protein [Nitrospirae bacterium]|nr:HU family DNA-binding protein [Nitrospirota bacterium]
MVKAELIKNMADDTQLDKKDVLKVVESFIDNIKKALSTGGKIALVGFGSFIARPRKAREGRNPRTGEIITIPEAMVPKFLPGKQLKDALIVRDKEETKVKQQGNKKEKMETKKPVQQKDKKGKKV